MSQSYFEPDDPRAKDLEDMRKRNEEHTRAYREMRDNPPPDAPSPEPAKE